MTRIHRGRRGPRPFDTPADDDARWAQMPDHARAEAAAADPVGFIADHLPARDRHDGTLVVLLQHQPGAPGGLVNLIDGAPAAPAAADCARLLAPFVAAARSGGCGGIGVVLHRTGLGEPTPGDQRWRSAVRAAAVDAGICDLGLATRLPDGTLLRLP